MKKAYLFALLGCLAMSACATKEGNQFLEKTSPEQLAASIVKGSTTKEEIRQMFGDPMDIDFMPTGLEVWAYEYKRSEAKAINFVPYASAVYNGTNDNRRRLKVLFNKKNVVESYTFVSSEGETKRGLLQ